MNENIDPAILQYIMNYLGIQLNQPSRIPTEDEVLAYNACLNAVRRFAELQADMFKATKEAVSADGIK